MMTRLSAPLLSAPLLSALLLGACASTGQNRGEVSVWKSPAPLAKLRLRAENRRPGPRCLSLAEGRARTRASKRVAAAFEAAFPQQKYSLSVRIIGRSQDDTKSCWAEAEAQAEGQEISPTE